MVFERAHSLRAEVLDQSRFDRALTKAEVREALEGERDFRLPLSKDLVGLPVEWVSVKVVETETRNGKETK